LEFIEREIVYEVHELYVREALRIYEKRVKG